MPSKKIIIITLIALVSLLVISLVLYRNLKTEKNQVERQAQALLDNNGDFSAQSTDAQINDLKQSLLFLAQEVGTIRSAESSAITSTSGTSRVASQNLSGNLSTSADLIIRIKSLEDKISVLEQKVGTSKSSPAPSNSTSTTPALKVQYIPIAASSTSNDQSGSTLDTSEISLDPSEFPGYTSIQLEVVMKQAEAVGEATVSLFNYTDGVTISNSSITTANTAYTTYSSQGVKLSSGRKTYRLWAKSSQGYTVYIQSARLKVNY